ncbi:MAG: YebG family protein [Deltaproteobacteria bacterium]|nr:YebG family protein [Deltaproteobacteria bacterium]
MAVIVQYIVVRNGEQKMTFTSKKEADAYDRLLDIADHMYAFLEAAEVDMSVDQLEELSFFLAKNREDAVSLLRGGKIKNKAAQPPADKPAAGRKAVKNKKSSAAGAASAAGK